ncbi:hypothetical protein Tco_0319805 [Tanacetum coccineum]
MLSLSLHAILHFLSLWMSLKYIFKICPRVQGREFDPLPSEEDTVSFLRELGHSGEINSLNDVVVDQMHQPWRTFAAIINRSLSGKTSGVVPPKIARKFKKASPSKKDSILVQANEEPVQKGKRVKRSSKKSSPTPTAGIVFRETPVKTKSTGKEKVDVSRGKGIDLLSEVALAEKAQLKEVRKKSLRDFHKTHPSGSGTVAKKPPSVEKITPTVTSEGTGDKPGVPDVTEDDYLLIVNLNTWIMNEDDSNNKQEASDEGSGQENESEEQESDSEQDEESDDDNQEEEEVDQENESEDDEIESDEDKGMDDTTDQFDDDVDARFEEPTQTGKEKTKVPVTSSSCSSNLASKFLNFLDIPHADAEIVSPLDVHVHHEVPSTLTPILLTVPILIITESSPIYTAIPQSLPSLTPPPPLSTPTPPPTTKTTNPLSILPDFASVFQFNNRIIALEKEVAELKKDPLHTKVTTLVDNHLETRLGDTREEFMNFLSVSLTARIKEQVRDQLPQILPKEVSNFAPPVLEKMIEESHNEVILAKESSQPQSTYEAAATLIEFELKKILIDKMDKSESYLAAPEHQECYDGLIKFYNVYKDFFSSYDKRKISKDAEPTTGLKNKDSTSGSSKGTKSQPKSSRKSIQSKKPVFEVADSNMPQDQEGNLGHNDDEPRKEAASRHDWFIKPIPPQEPSDPD